MKVKQEHLIQQLAEQIQQQILQVKKYQEYTLEELNYKESSERWSILECIEHLNLYAAFYTKESHRAINSSKHSTGLEQIFKSTFFGNYSAESMLPKDGVIKNKMKTFKDKNPVLTAAQSTLDKSVLKQFIQDQQSFLEHIASAKNKNWNKIKLSLTIPLLKFNLGDTLRFVLNHVDRHLLQAERINIPSKV